MWCILGSFPVIFSTQTEPVVEGLAIRWQHGYMGVHVLKQQHVCVNELLCMKMT